MTNAIHKRLLHGLAVAARCNSFLGCGADSMSSLRFLFMAAMIAYVMAGATAHATEARYECNSGTALTAQFSPPGATPGQVVLTFDGSQRSIVLPQVMSADGGRYAKGNTEFWIKGRDATLTRNGTRETCTSR